MLTVQIGQCGNQIGNNLFDELRKQDARCNTDSNNVSRTRESAFFKADKERYLARALLIDMEPKVVQRCLTRKVGQIWSYESSNALYQQSGSGNNWAHGYFVHGVKMEAAFQECLRKEAEQSDRLQGFLTLQSVAGGTGSGLGSFLTQSIVDSFPKKSILSTVIWPYTSGEVVVQNYNALLTIASLAQLADGILVMENDTAHAVCRRLLRRQRPSINDLNKLLATQLASAFLPTTSTHTSTITDIFGHLCTHPAYKLLHLSSAPHVAQNSKAFSTHTWDGLLRDLFQMHYKKRVEESFRMKHPSLASLLFLRGKDTVTVDTSSFADRQLFPVWRKRPLRTLTETTLAIDKMATVLSNSGTLIPILESTLAKAYDMFGHKAYVHQYQRSGMDQAFFQESFLHCEQIVHSYKTLQ
uniref:Tubulin delta chain n=1 Tax=Albugo laibachii Nc14 TaxID=890382 RepID=F0WHD4_9STRA|nr:tubulin/FtsZ family putative [Albugo laibachii Nc14]|eukprot:CCA20653.1 tubulin/FtsZ family putative [Albugo laibachii Nc14]